MSHHMRSNNIKIEWAVTKTYKWMLVIPISDKKPKQKGVLQRYCLYYFWIFNMHLPVMRNQLNGHHFYFFCNCTYSDLKYRTLVSVDWYICTFYITVELCSYHKKLGCLKLKDILLYSKKPFFDISSINILPYLRKLNRIIF